MRILTRAIVFVALTTSAEAADPQTLIGVWCDSLAHRVYEYRTDGTYKSDLMGYIETGIWSAAAGDGDLIEFSIDNVSSSVRVKYPVDEATELTFYAPDGGKIGVLRRCKINADGVSYSSDIETDKYKRQNSAQKP